MRVNWHASAREKIKIHFLYHNIIPTLSSSAQPPAEREKKQLFRTVTSLQAPTQIRAIFSRSRRVCRTWSRLQALGSRITHFFTSWNSAKHVTSGSINKNSRKILLKKVCCCDVTKRNASPLRWGLSCQYLFLIRPPTREGRKKKRQTVFVFIVDQYKCDKVKTEW